MPMTLMPGKTKRRISMRSVSRAFWAGVRVSVG